MFIRIFRFKATHVRGVHNSIVKSMDLANIIAQVLRREKMPGYKSNILHGWMGCMWSALFLPTALPWYTMFYRGTR
jgi:hypothetical protein